MSIKTIEIYYDVMDIPDISDRSEWSREALEFRNDAMEHIEVAIQHANAGEWAGAEIGANEVNFGFSVEDFDYAEMVVRESVAGTVFEGIREIARRDTPQEQLDEYAAQAATACLIFAGSGLPARRQRYG